MPPAARAPIEPTDPAVADEIVATVRRFVQREVLPVASAMEHADTYPADIVAGMRELGLFGATIPAEHGGLGLDVVTYTRIVEELSAGWMSLSGVVNTHLIAAGLIARHGTDDQRARWLPAMAAGDLRGCLSLSEPDAGSDTRALRCKATPDGDTYVIDGTKMWVTNGERAGLVALAARTPEGISCFMVEKEPGPRDHGSLTTSHIGKLGYKGVETVEMTWTEHRVPAEALLGGEDGLGRGLHFILAGLELGRINIAARAVGVGRAAYEAAMAYAQERHTFGKPIAEHQAIQFKLADMATKLEAARLLTRSAAERYQSGERADVEAGMAKLFASEAAFEIATESMRVHGGYGYATEYPVERYFRDTPLMIIGEGTNEIQRLVIARGLLARWQEALGS
ncbi:MAG TPA: acyl-CoA dehydrogenase family protein [Acidimicrobiales bacterium]|nr:acyl-CoA dehydrogenase family protein [Acidimicrobiales bacterium]